MAQRASGEDAHRKYHAGSVHVVGRFVSSYQREDPNTPQQLY